MANKLILSTSDDTLRELLGNGKKYIVPKFQRDYSWKEEHWQALWEDLDMLFGGQEDYHYMGYLVLQEQEGSNLSFMLVDGQQRFTTFSLMILAAIDRLKNIKSEEEENGERADELFKNFIGVKDITYLTVENKLKLNRNNDYYYREIVENNPIPQRGVKNTVRLMTKAFDFFIGKFGNFEKGENISQFIEKIVNRVLFTTIHIGDDLNAYKVFETLNARGVKLSTADLLKNYLFSVIDDKQNAPSEVMDPLDEKWEKIGGNIEGKSYTDYILTQWNSEHARVRHNLLFREIKQHIKNKEDSRSYLNKLEQNSRLYTALFNSTDEFWKDESQYIQIRKDIEFLNLFNIRQPISLLMASYVNFRQDFHKVLKWIKVFSLRYNVICREHTGEQEGVYSRICVTISNGCGVQDIRELLMQLYPSDEKFKQAFIDKIIPTQQSNKKARYLLARLEEFQNAQRDIDETDLTIEHILPLKPNDDWIDYFGSDNYELFNQRLGNMALVKSTLNQDMDQKPFTDKKAMLLDTNYQTNMMIREYDEWDMQSIESRQKKLAALAVRLWRIEY